MGLTISWHCSRCRDGCDRFLAEVSGEILESLVGVILAEAGCKQENQTLIRPSQPISCSRELINMVGSGCPASFYHFFLFHF